MKRHLPTDLKDQAACTHTPFLQYSACARLIWPYTQPERIYKCRCLCLFTVWDDRRARRVGSVVRRVRQVERVAAGLLLTTQHHRGGLGVDGWVA